MPYFRVDDGWWSHPKTLALSPAARDLWVRAGSYSMQHFTDGLLSQQALKTLGAKPKQINELVEVGYWEPILGGIEFHDWAHYQESADVLRQRRDKARERMRKLRGQQNEARTDTEPADDVRANKPRTFDDSARDVSELSPSHPFRTGVNEEASVPETSRAEGPDEAGARIHFIEAAMRKKVDFRKVRARLSEQAPDACIPDELAWGIVEAILDRAKPRGGDRTGVVLTSITRDWAEWSQMVYRQVGA